MEPITPPVLPTRSTQGCWTCRLRKKKCDEVQPSCQRCASSNIDCHYGARPKWVDDSAMGKRELERIKIIVKASASRKRAAFRLKHRVAETASPQHSPVLEDPSSQELGESQGTPSEIDGAISPTTDTLSGVAVKQPAIDGNEANLMMHYLDNVFYIQFRFHQPCISAGGRGWLLSLLNCTKPLYHAALSLSAFHQQSLIWGDQPQTDYLEALQRHHNLALGELQLFIHAHSENRLARGAFGGNVQILACMVQLISFELFNGGESNWQVHLSAAANLISLLHGITPSDSPQLEDRTPSSPEPNNNKNMNATGLHFLTSAIIWFDILACVTTGSKPHLAEHHDYLLTSPHLPGISGEHVKVHLHKIMGCQNWVMSLISEIAVLGATNTSEFKDMQHFAQTAKDIQGRLESQTAEVRQELKAVQQQYSGAPPHYLLYTYSHYITLLVTNIFACAAVIYIQTVVTSNPTIFHIQDPLQDIMDALSMVPDPRMIRGLVWPLCIAGCMASSPSDQEFFRNAAGGAIADSRTFGNSGKALEVLESAWALQEIEGRLVDCSTCLQKSGTFVLLV